MNGSLAPDYSPSVSALDDIWRCLRSTTFPIVVERRLW
jgi:hypothetical protein